MSSESYISPVRAERSRVLAYIAAIGAASVVSILPSMLRETRFQTPASSAMALAIAVVSCFLAIPVFAVIRILSRHRGLATWYGAIFWGMVGGILFIPLGNLVSVFLDALGPGRSYDQLLLEALQNPQVYETQLSAGATAGLVYWLIAFAPARKLLKKPHWLAPLLSPPSGSRWLARTAAATATGAAVAWLAWSGLIVWWRPHAVDESGGRLPRIELEREIAWHGRSGADGVAWTPDGATIVASACSSGLFQVWATDGRFIRRLDGPHPCAPDHIELADDGRFLIARGGRRNETGPGLFIVDRITGQPAHPDFDVQPQPRFRGQIDLAAFAVSADGSHVAAGYRGDTFSRIDLFDPRRWVRITTLDACTPGPNSINQMAISPSGKLLAVAVAQSVCVLDLTSRQVVRTVPLEAAVSSAPLAFSPDGRFIAIAHNGPASRPSATGTMVLRQPDGQTIAIDTWISIVRLTDGMTVATYPDATAGVGGSLAWDPHGRFVAFMGDRDVLHLWAPFAGGRMEETIRLRPAGQFQFTPRGDRLAVANGGAISIFRVG